MKSAPPGAKDQRPHYDWCADINHEGEFCTPGALSPEEGRALFHMSDEEYARVQPSLKGPTVDEELEAAGVDVDAFLGKVRRRIEEVQREDVVRWTLGWAIALTEMGAAIANTYLCAGCECHLGPYERGPFVCGCAFFDEHVCATQRHGDGTGEG